jgi:hypothetical protein
MKQVTSFVFLSDLFDRSPTNIWWREMVVVRDERVGRWRERDEELGTAQRDSVRSVRNGS